MNNGVTIQGSLLARGWSWSHERAAARAHFSAALVALTTMALLLCGCASGVTRGSPGGVDYVYCLLKTGPESANKTKDERQTIFAGHMSNMKRLSDEGHLIIAGPFSEPRDKTWRGIFLFNVETVEKAKELVATDPGVVAGVFTPELRACRGRPGLQTVPALEKKLLAENESKGTPAPKPGEPPPNIRAYVMLTTSDIDGTRKAVHASSLAQSIVWSVNFVNDRGGVLVLDAEKVADVQAALGERVISKYDIGLDGWWSTESLTQLRRG